ncbi:hypothetical protein [Saccharothrix saharensis]|uniref:hypothetical protein n=1 Tax=Saccharothrix saharensis TaxID=571190 RepID=UPI001B8872F9|nr:hypothetical protein [Saccharothrix saharensis]
MADAPVADVTSGNRGTGLEVCRQLASLGHLTGRHGRVDVPVDDAAIHYDTRQRASSADPGVARAAVETNFPGPRRGCCRCRGRRAARRW